MRLLLNINGKSTGFTLIELLVVISIIGVLASVVLSSLESARASARDVERISDLKQIQTALEMYRNDHGFFPCENRLNCPGQTVNANGIIGEGSGIDTLLAPYLPTIPGDPLGSVNNVTYRYYYDGANMIAEGTVSVRSRQGGDLGSRSVREFVDEARVEIETKGQAGQPAGV